MDQTPSLTATQIIVGILRPALESAGGWRAVGKRFLLLAISAFAIFMPVAALWELHRVDQVRDWMPVTVVVDKVEWAKPAFRKSQYHWVFSFRDPASTQLWHTGDLAPGDMPFSVLGWSSMDARAQAWADRAGENVTVWRSPDGSEVYPEKGDPMLMRLMLALCAGFWLWRWQRRRIAVHSA
jgi:hypothetical protein